jgi:hypothetical protein
MNTAALSVRPGMSRTMKKVFWLLTATTALIGLVARASWSAPWDNFDTNADGRLVDVRVLVNGHSAPLYTAPGRYDRSYFQAFRRQNYSLLLHNNTGRRVGVLIAVDGLNVISGDQSGLSRNEAMYVLDPYEETTINGWRTSLDEVRRFVFVDEEHSYAERTGQANGDMGWIRVLAFREQVSPWDQIQKYRQPERPYGGQREDGPGLDQAPRAQAAPQIENMAPEQSKMYADRQDESNPGTGWGDRKSDHVSRTSFRPEANPVDRITLRYEYARGLAQLGIRVRGNRTWERDRGEMGFAQPPRW